MKFKLLLSLSFITVLASCGGAEERKSVYMKKAKSSIAIGDFDKARIELKNVLQIDPKDSEAYYQLGKVFEHHNDYKKAFSSYKKAEELNPALLENQARLGRIYLLLAHDAEKTQEIVHLILSKEPENAEGLLLKAALLLKDNKKSEAIKIGNDIISKDPGNVEGAMFVASLYLKDKKSDEAIEIIKTALKEASDETNDSDRLNVLLATAYIRIKDYSSAERIYTGFIKKYPDSRASYNKLAALYLVADEKQKVKETLRSSIEAQPDDPQRYIELVTYINQIDGKEAAIAELKSAVLKNEKIGKLRLALGELHVLDKDTESAKTVYKKAINDFPEELTAIESTVALSSIYYNEGDFEKAGGIIDETIKLTPNNPKLNFINARLALQNNDPEKAILSLRIVIKETPENVDAYFLLINAYALEENVDQISSTLNSAYENNKNNPASLLKLTKYYLPRDIDKASKIIDDYNKLKPDDYEGLSIKSAILNNAKKYDEALIIADELKKTHSKLPNGYLQAVPYYVEKGDEQKAISILESGYINVTDNRKILELLTKLQVADKKFEIVEKRIDTELRQSPDDNGLKLLLAKVYLVNNKVDLSEKLLTEIVGSKVAAEEPYILLSRIHKSKNDTISERSVLISGRDNVLNSYKIPLKLAASYEFSGDYAPAIDVYRNLYNLYPDNLVVVNNLASMLSDHSIEKDDLELMRVLADKLTVSAQPIFLDTIGWVDYKLGNYSAAIENLTKVVELSPEVNVFNYHIGMAYKMAGDNAQAKIYLKKSLNDGKDFNEKDLAKAALNEI